MANLDVTDARLPITVSENVLRADTAPEPAHAAYDQPILISIVVPCFDEQDVLLELYSRLCDLAKRLKDDDGCESEFILVDDGSCDGTWPLICNFAAKDRRVSGVQFSRNFGHQAALACGYEHSRGDAVVSLDADLQDPPEVVPDLVRAWREGADVVFAVRESRVGDTWFKRLTAWLFYWGINKLGGSHVRKNVGDFRLVSRRCVDVLNQFSERGRFFRDLAGWIGFPTAEVRYRRQPRRAGMSKYTFKRMQQLATEGIVSVTTRPLRFSWYAAAFAGLLSVFLGIITFAWRPDARALLLSISVILLCTTLVLVGQGVQGLYLSKLYDEGRKRPVYLVSDHTRLRSESGQPGKHSNSGSAIDDSLPVR